METCVFKSHDDEYGSVLHKRLIFIYTYLAGIYTKTDIDRITSSQVLSRSHFKTIHFH